jgi:hypothetical protein
MDSARRQLLKVAALLFYPALFQNAEAAANASVREQLKYQGHPKNDMSCSSCLEFIPGQTLGGCKLIPGDDEISPSGYCTKWNSI